MRLIAFLLAARDRMFVRLPAFVFLPLLALLSFSAFGASDPFDDEFDEKPWSEIEVQLPAFPKEEDLIPFRVGAIRDRQFMVDGASFSIGSDDVIRFTVVVISPIGARNISYEGMRCATGERRFYAFGHPDTGWSKAKGSRWFRVSGGSNNHHVELYSNFFCTVGAPEVDAGAIRFGLRNGGLMAKER